MRKEVKDLLRLSVSVSIPLGVGFLVAMMKTSADMDWFFHLKLPSFMPPMEMFKRVWIYLYVLMGIALYFIWSHEPSPKRKVAFILFGIQLFLNAMWPIFFFTFHSPGAAMIEMVALLSFIALTMHAFFRVSRVVGYLFIPYVGWILYALVINVGIFLMNA